jgi:hypothetical protein
MMTSDRPRLDTLTPEQQREAVRLFVQAAFFASLEPEIRAGIRVASRVMQTTPAEVRQKLLDQTAKLGVNS